MEYTNAEVWQGMDKLEERRNHLRRQTESQFENPPNNDERIAAFSAALLDAEQDDSQMRGLLDRYLLEHPDRSVSYQHNHILRSIVHPIVKYRHAFMAETDLRYPEDFRDPIAWQRAFEFVLRPGSEQYTELRTNLSHREVQSNITERYKAVKVLLHLTQERRRVADKDESSDSSYDFGADDGFRPARVVDIGCSRNHGLKKIAYGQFWATKPFEPVRVSNPEDGQVARLFNELADRNIQLANSVGVDLQGLDSEDSRLWAFTCSFYPSEMLDIEKVEEYDVLETASGGAVDFEQGDFTEVDTVDFRQRHGLLEGADMAVFSTVLYQSSEEQRVAMLENAKRLLAPGGIIVVNEFAEIDETTPSGLRFEERWFEKPFPYRTFVYDPLVGNRFMEYFRWNNGRLGELQPGQDLPNLHLFQQAS